MTKSELADLFDAMTDATDTFRWEEAEDLTIQMVQDAGILSPDELTCVQAGYMAALLDAESLLRGQDRVESEADYVRRSLICTARLLAELSMRNVVEVG